MNAQDTPDLLPASLAEAGNHLEVKELEGELVRRTGEGYAPDKSTGTCTLTMGNRGEVPPPVPLPSQKGDSVIHVGLRSKLALL